MASQTVAAVLDLALEADLRARSAQIVSQVERSDKADLAAAARLPLEPAESFAQILRPSGSVVAASAYPDVRLLSEEQLRAASAGELLVDRPGDAAIDESLRLLATPAQAGDLTVRVSGIADAAGAVRVAACTEPEFLKTCRLVASAPPLLDQLGRLGLSRRLPVVPTLEQAASSLRLAPRLLTASTVLPPPTLLAALRGGYELDRPD